MVIFSDFNLPFDCSIHNCFTRFKSSTLRELKIKPAMGKVLIRKHIPKNQKHTNTRERKK